MQKLKEIAPMTLPLIVTFYIIYPQALNVMGSSFILLSGVLGLGLYAYQRFPIKETFVVIGAMGVMLFWFYSVSWYNGSDDPYTLGYFKSEIAWLFSSYLLVFSIYKIHKRPSVDTVLFYIVAAVALQCLITFLMYINEPIADFFFSLQFQVEYSEAVVAENSWQRLMGYGIAFFGAGANNGIALVVLSYLLVRRTLETKEFLLLSTLYVFIFYISLFMARTTVIGAATGFILIAFLYVTDRHAQKKQIRNFVLSSVFLLFGGYIFAMFYFENLADWAFELFINFVEKGSLETKSSNGLTEMFEIPEDLGVLMFGDGRMVFRGTDIGYSRMLYYVGIVGSVLFYGFAFFLVKMWGVKHWAINMLGYALCIYGLILNIKGWFDLNHIFFIIFFYFMFYKYYVYMPRQNTDTSIAAIKRRRKLDNTKDISE